MDIPDQVKMAARMGMKAGFDMAISLLEQVAADPRSGTTVTVKDSMEIAVQCLREQAEEEWPEGQA